MEIKVGKDGGAGDPVGKGTELKPRSFPFMNILKLADMCFFGCVMEVISIPRICCFETHKSRDLRKGGASVSIFEMLALEKENNCPSVQTGYTTEDLGSRSQKSRRVHPHRGSNPLWECTCCQSLGAPPPGV